MGFAVNTLACVQTLKTMGEASEHSSISANPVIKPGSFLLEFSTQALTCIPQPAHKEHRIEE